MTAVYFSPLAVADLDDILEYIARDKPRSAVAFVELLKEKCRLLGKYPLLGAKRDELAQDLRIYSIRNYVIYYRPLADGVRIERVLHGARDADALV